MNEADYVILGIILLSLLIGLIRGLLREVLSFVTWVAALLIAWTFYQGFADKFAHWIPHLSVRLAVAFLVLFFPVLILGAVVDHLLFTLLKKKGFTNVDRILGAVFGVLRGVILIAILAFLGEEFMPLLAVEDENGNKQDPEWWQKSLLIDRFQVAAENILAYIPQQTKDGLKRL